MKHDAYTSNVHSMNSDLKPFREKKDHVLSYYSFLFLGPARRKMAKYFKHFPGAKCYVAIVVLLGKKRNRNYNKKLYEKKKNMMHHRKSTHFQYTSKTTKVPMRTQSYPKQPLGSHGYFAKCGFSSTGLCRRFVVVLSKFYRRPPTNTSIKVTSIRDNQKRVELPRVNQD